MKFLIPAIAALFVLGACTPGVQSVADTVCTTYNQILEQAAIQGLPWEAIAIEEFGYSPEQVAQFKANVQVGCLVATQ